MDEEDDEEDDEYVDNEDDDEDDGMDNEETKRHGRGAQPGARPGADADPIDSAEEDTEPEDGEQSVGSPHGRVATADLPTEIAPPPSTAADLAQVSGDPSMASLLEVLRAVRARCEAEDLTPLDELQSACRAFAQQIGVLEHTPARTVAGEAVREAAREHDPPLVVQLSLCACRYLKGWLAANDGGSAPAASVIAAALGISGRDEAAISGSEMAAAFAAAGWDWDAERFDGATRAEGRQGGDGEVDGFPVGGRARRVAEALCRIADRARPGGEAQVRGRRAKYRPPAASSATTENTPAAAPSLSGEVRSGVHRSRDAAPAAPRGASGARGHLSSRQQLPEDLVVRFDLFQATTQLARATARREEARHSGGGGSKSVLVAASTSTAAGSESAAPTTVPAADALERATRVRADEIERELTRELPKTAFRLMEVLGQFNLGFIIARVRLPPTAGDGDGGESPEDRREVAPGDLYIVDQHAADEKIRFETLQQTTEIHTQRLIAPLPLHLTAADELLVVDHMHVFVANGFGISVDAEAPPTQRLHLVSLPLSKATLFGPADVHDLVTLLADNPSASVRLPKLRSMFASRACRSAVMIGTALDAPKMASYVRQLATLDQPWNCPHGRPTLRHLIDLKQLASTQCSIEFECTRC